MNTLLKAILVPVFLLWFAPSAFALIGGKPVDIGKYPWLVAIVDQAESNQSSLCHTGVLIDPKWVLTSASCIMSFDTERASDPEGIQVITGRTSLTDTGGQVIQAEQILIPRYGQVRQNTNNSAFHRWYTPDIALIKLSRESTSPTASIATTDSPGVAASVAGFGRTTPEGGAMNNIHEIDGEILTEHAACSTGYSRWQGHGYDTLEANVLCTVSPDTQGTCGGDVGSPLFVANPNDNSKAVIYGMLSFSVATPSSRYDCADYGLDHGTGFSRLSRHTDWIESKIVENPEAVISYRCEYQSCAFNGGQSTNPNGRVVAYNWVIDGVAYSGRTVNLTLRPGLMSAELTVIDALGRQNKTSINFIVGRELTGPVKRKFIASTNTNARRILLPRRNGFLANKGIIAGRITSRGGSTHSLTLLKYDSESRTYRPVKTTVARARVKKLRYTAKTGYYRWLVRSGRNNGGKFTLNATNR